MEGWVDLGYPAMHRLGTELAISRSQVRRPNHRAIIGRVSGMEPVQVVMHKLRQTAIELPRITDKMNNHIQKTL